MITVKLFVIVSLVLAASTVQGGLSRSQFGPKLEAVVRPLHARCAFRTGADEYSINKVINGIFPEGPRIKAYTACLLRESNTINALGQLDLTAAANVLPEDVRDEALSNVQYCYEQVNGIARLEDKSFALLKCYRDLNPDSFIFF